MNSINLQSTIKEAHFSNICKSYLAYGREHAIKYLMAFKGNDILNADDINFILLRRFALSNTTMNTPLATTVKVYLDNNFIPELNCVINKVPEIKKVLLSNYIDNMNKPLLDLLTEKVHYEYDSILPVLSSLEEYYLGRERIVVPKQKSKIEY